MISKPVNRSFYIGQIITNFEYAASLYNKSMLNEEASEILSRYILDVMRGFEGDIDADIFFEKLREDSDTLSHLSVFLKKHGRI